MIPNTIDLVFSKRIYVTSDAAIDSSTVSVIVTVK